MPDPAIARLPADSLDDYRWLTGPEGADWLARARALDGELTAKAARLRARLPPSRASLVLKQIELRRRAREKFTAADSMFFTARGLEQATDEVVALYKAARMPPGKRVFDLCAGIGGDLVALARHCETIGTDRDPVCATIAAANARALLEPARQPKITLGEAAEADLAGCHAWHIDPDRRPRGKRTTRVDLHDPATAVIDGLLAQNPHAAVKLAPAAELPDHWTEQAELEWIGRARGCRQLVAWFGTLAQEAGRRRATILGPSAEQVRTLVGRADQNVPVAPRIERYLFEPDAAVLAAKLEAALAAEHDLAAISSGVAYWTGPAAIADRALACFEIDEVLPLDVKRLGALLRARGIGRLEIKVRSVDQDPGQLRRRLRVVGDREATLLVTRIEKRVMAILARRTAN
ncbi:MAG: hypothetical protein WD063_15235 [Pirellulales bacterium]